MSDSLTFGNQNTNLLKLIGIVTMTIDHIGKVFFQDELEWQLIGRLTFPIFSYCLVVGFLYTSDQRSYLKRLFVFSLLSQPFYFLAFDYQWYELNIFFSLLLALISLYAIKERHWWALAIVLLAALLLKVDYGIQGILAVNLMYIFRKRPLFFACSLVVHYASLLFVDSNEILRRLLLTMHLNIEPSPSLNVFGVLSIPLICIRMGRNIRVNRDLFYLYYPLHLFILMIAKNYISIF